MTQLVESTRKTLSLFLRNIHPELDLKQPQNFELRKEVSSLQN